MTPGLRLFRFSLVGLIGIAVQLGVLAALTAMKMNYLLATGLAVEAAVLHNFLWHQRFTWADRAGAGVRAALAQLLRFHLSNGLISIAGNLLLMRLLAGWLGWPVLPANLTTISLCYAANYLASDRWVFLPRRTVAHQQQSALGEGKIDQGGSGGQGQPQPDLWRQQKRGERPELIEHEDSGEQTKKLSAETSNIKPDRREQIETDRNAHRGRCHQDGRDPRRVPERVLQQFFDYAQPGQRADVEAEIENLNEQKEYAHIPVRDRRQVFGTSEQ
jgi:putative flippase GtrA